MTDPLPSSGFSRRLLDAIQRWELATGRVGRGRTQAEVHRLLLERYGNAAPSREAVSKWVKGDYVPSTDYCFMLAAVLEVRPAWLAFDDGPMQAGPAALDEDEAKRQFLEEQERKYGAGSHPAPTRKPHRRTG